MGLAEEIGHRDGKAGQHVTAIKLVIGSEGSGGAVRVMDGDDFENRLNDPYE